MTSLQTAPADYRSATQLEPLKNSFGRPIALLSPNFNRYGVLCILSSTASDDGSHWLTEANNLKTKEKSSNTLYLPVIFEFPVILPSDSDLMAVRLPREYL
ncbi:hypothetical protein EVAR_70547_1 [Eumeta japonica]|uniref:Uncharacterized protein n=1 Tax=Eumeta variegata TaxID=151549 RepID=A0A4C1SLY6_EUMVA|nr:hypothetical protein EVAR_70547_1 [Eumeta japonica]